MKKQLIRVAPLQSAKVMAVLYLVLSIPFCLIYLVMPTMGAPMPWWGLILFPILYMVLGFLFTLVGAAIYNLVAAGVGGFEFTTVDVAPGENFG